MADLIAAKRELVAAMRADSVRRVKLQDGRDPGLQVARGDLKAGRLGQLTPFEVLDYFARTGELDALERWNRYEVVLAPPGHHVDQGLCRRLLPHDEELTDEGWQHNR